MELQPTIVRYSLHVLRIRNNVSLPGGVFSCWCQYQPDFSKFRICMVIRSHGHDTIHSMNRIYQLMVEIRTLILAQGLWATKPGHKAMVKRSESEECCPKSLHDKCICTIYGKCISTRQRRQTAELLTIKLFQSC